MGKPKPPKPPDPIKTAAGQTSTNVATAIANARLQNVNQITPEGTLTFDETGTSIFNDPVTGNTFEIPQFTATQSLSPEQQAILDQSQAAQLNLATLGQEQSGRLQGLLGTNVDLSNDAVESRLFDLGTRRLNPLFEEREDALRARLANQGIQAGSTAFDREFNRFGQDRNDAFNQLLLQGRGQAVQEALTERNQPINEITALLSGSQVSQPNFLGGVQPGAIPTTDFAGITDRAFQNELAAFNAKQAGGGLFGAIGGITSAIAPFFALSDERTKKNKEKVGKVKGHNLWEFNYVDEPEGTPKHIGLMAQEVEKKNPDAVETLFGDIKVVNYTEALSGPEARDG